MDRRLSELSANKFYDTGFGDDAVGLEIGVEPWIDGLFPAVLQHFKAFTAVNVPKVSYTIVPNMNNSASSLLNSVGILRDTTELTVPLIPAKFETIKVEYQNSQEKVPGFYFEKLPTMDSEIMNASIISLRELTLSYIPDDNNSSDFDKSVLEATILIDSIDIINYEPGDSFGFLCGNSDEEVFLVLNLLGLHNKSSELCKIEGKNIDCFPRLVSLYNLVKYYLEVRSIPKKTCLRHFAEYCSDEAQKRRLLELSSREGANDYTKFIRNPGVNLLDILVNFDSCKPSLEVLLSNVPCFAPRYYSVINCFSEERPSELKIAFSVVKLSSICNRKGTQLYGVFTGMMQRLHDSLKADSIESKLKALSFENDFQLKIFKRKNNSFKLAKDSTTPLILIGPGTGVAPFIGFLEALNKQKMLGPIGEVWLFFGCRHPEHDFIYKEEMYFFKKTGVLSKLCICFSRQLDSDDAPKYVHEYLQQFGPEISSLIESKKCVVYVCGDVKMMSVNVFNSFVNIVETEQELNHEAAVKYVRDLQANKRYFQDVWL